MKSRLCLAVIFVVILSLACSALVKDEGNIPTSVGLAYDIMPGAIFSLTLPAGKYHSFSLGAGFATVGYYNYYINTMGFYTHTGKVKDSWTFQGPIVGIMYQSENISGYNVSRSVLNLYPYLAYQYGWRSEWRMFNLTLSAGPYYTKDQFGISAKVGLDYEPENFIK